MNAGTISRHGTTARYTNRRCRCEVCREAWFAYSQAYRARRSPPPPGDQRHGKLVTYVIDRCRCDECRAARSAYDREYRARKAGAR